MTQISTKNSVVTLINVFTVDPTHQQRLVELLTRATEVSVRHAPGFARKRVAMADVRYSRSCKECKRPWART